MTYHPAEHAHRARKVDALIAASDRAPAPFTADELERAGYRCDV